jgi:hypothetical protein
MARKESDFKHDGIAAGLSYAYKKGTDISTAADVVAAPSVSTDSIVVTDIVVSKGTAGTVTVQDGATEVADLYVAAAAVNSVNLSGPLKLTAGNALKMKLNNTNTNYSILVTYYLQS